MARRSPASDFHSPDFDIQPEFLQVEIAGQIASKSYVEAGPTHSETVVLLHGNPTWSFLYREIIKQLSTDWHVIAPDLLGMGRSDKLDHSSNYSLENYVDSMGQFMEKLELNNVTLVVHDWGGPIGLSWAVENPGKVSRLVIQNTWAFTPKEHNKVPQPLKTFRKPFLGECLVQGMNLFVNAMLPLGVVDKINLLWEPMFAYRAPFETWSDLAPVLAFPREIPMKPGDRAYNRIKATDNGLKDLDQPVLMLWGKKDPVFPPRVIQKFEERLDNIYDKRIFKDASHFLQEDRPDAISEEIDEFLSNT